jgi:hypothetical protein
MKSTLIVLFSLPYLSVAFAAKGKTFEECQALAISRGMSAQEKMPSRYLALKSEGHATRPQGFMARCMAGVQN